MVGDHSRLRVHTNEFEWIVNPEHKDRDVADLLYFPTGGGKTEAHLGLMAFVIANRRLRASEASEYNADGGVTVMFAIRYAFDDTAERSNYENGCCRWTYSSKTYPKYGKEPISIGFWVGGVTPNKFDELVEKADKLGRGKRKRNLLYKQLLTCPFCGKPLTEDEFYIDPDRKSVAIYCADRNCMFYKYKQDRIKIPVYLVDEEIHAKCPTIILSTVDKFARLLGMLRQMRCLEELIGFAAVMVMLPLVKNINDTIGRKNFPLQH